MKAQFRLNPYYTGIHLHLKKGNFTTPRTACLNPYYTGIHLHVPICISTPIRRSGLNPYYTGIHLHPKMMKSLPSAVVVLILIILEYIYIHEYNSRSSVYCVLILIILEYIYIVCLFCLVYLSRLVLILIILEYIYIISCPAGAWSIFCLNPYYTGIHLHLNLMLKRQTAGLS